MIKQGTENYSTNKENEVSELFIILLVNKSSGKTHTDIKQAVVRRSMRTLHYPIIAQVCRALPLVVYKFARNLPFHKSVPLKIRPLILCLEGNFTYSLHYSGGLYEFEVCKFKEKIPTTTQKCILALFLLFKFKTWKKKKEKLR